MLEQHVYVIWSNEHRAWWGPGERGYVERLADAGCYPRSRAVEIAKHAQDGRARRDPPPEIALPYSDALECVRW